MFFFQAEDGIRGVCLSRGLGDMYKGQARVRAQVRAQIRGLARATKQSDKELID